MRANRSANIGDSAKATLTHQKLYFKVTLFLLTLVGLLNLSENIGAADASVRLSAVIIDNLPYMSHFADTTPGPANGWLNDYNCSMTASGQGSAKALMGSADNYGWVKTNTLTVNVDTNNILRLVTTEVDLATGNTIYLHEVGQSRIQVAAGVGVGITEINIPTKTGWSGVKNFSIEIEIQSNTAGTGMRFDEIWIYPSGSVAYQEDFKLSGNPPGGWFNNTNADVTANGLDSMQLSTHAVNNPPNGNWCSATSNSNPINLNTYGILSVVITHVDTGTGNQLLLYNVTDNVKKRMDASGLGAGVYNFDIKTVTGWSGTKTIYVNLVAETGSSIGVGTRYDQITIGSVNQ